MIPRKIAPVALTASTLVVMCCWFSSRNTPPFSLWRERRSSEHRIATTAVVRGKELREGYEGESHRALWTAGVPGEGLLLAEANNHEKGDVDWLDPELPYPGTVPHTSGHRHKEFLPLNKWDIATLILASFGLMIAAVGGIGGGGILVPIYILVLQFSPKYAVPLSNITIFGGAITNTFLNMKKRHPLADRPLVDWDLILVMEPLTIGGSLVGSFIQKVLPEVALTLMMVVLLVATADRTLRKGIKCYKKESKQLKESKVTSFAAEKLAKKGAALLGSGTQAQISYGAAARVENGNGHFAPAVLAPKLAKIVSGSVVGDEETAEMIPTIPNSPEGDDIEVEAQVLVSKASKVPSLEDLLEGERHTSVPKVAIMTAVFGVLLAVNLLKGGGAFESPLGIECGSFAFWATSVLSLVYLLLVSFRVREYLVARWRLKSQLGFKYVDGDVEWSPLNTLRYPAICFFAGFFAGMFGVGGGIVKGPLMLEMGVHPMVASSTSAVMILYTSFTATTSFVVFGLLEVNYAIPLFFLGLVATAAGQAGTEYLVQKFKRPSFIVLSIGSVVALSALLMGFNGLNDLLYPALEGSRPEGGICSAGV